MRFEVKPYFRKWGIALVLFLTIGLMRVNFARAGGTPTYPSPFSVNYFVNANQSGLDELYIQNKANNGDSIEGQDVCALVFDLSLAKYLVAKAIGPQIGRASCRERV